MISFKFASVLEFHVNRDTMDVVKQSAALCLLRLLRTCPEVIPSGEWTSRIIHLLNDQHLGVVTAAASLIEALVKRNADEYKGCVSLAVSRLSRVSKFFMFVIVYFWIDTHEVMVNNCDNGFILVFADCNSKLHWSSGLYLLLCTRSMAVGEIVEITAKLPSSR